MSAYSENSCNVSNGSATVIGNDTSFSSNVSEGDLFAVSGDGITYEVASVQGDLEFTLTGAYQGDDANSVNYIIVRDFTPSRQYPVIYRGDIETAAIVRRGFMKIDADQSGRLFFVEEDTNTVTFEEGAF